MSFSTIVAEVLGSPRSFFKKLTKEKGLKKAFLFFMSILAINVALTFLVGRFTQPILQNYLQNIVGAPALEYHGFVFDLITTIFGYGLGLLWGLFVAAVLLVWLIIWGGNPSYEKTFQLYAYTSTPSLLFGWIPVLGALAWFYDMGLLIVGTPYVVKGITPKKSVWVYVIPMILLLLFYLLIIGLVFFFISATGLSSMVGQAFLS